MLLVPYGVDNPMSRLPWANWALIAGNVVVFGFQMAAGSELVWIDGWIVSMNRLVGDYGLVPADLRWFQPITSAFLHAGYLHLFGNMIFLWTFGNNVNDRLGHVLYIGVYLIFAYLAGLGHVLMEHGSSVPCIGASGAVFGVMGTYLAFFPINDVRMCYWIIIRAGTFSCSAFWVIGFWIALNIYYATSGSGGNMAVAAHLAGAAAGFALGLFLLSRKLVERDEYDLLSWLARRRGEDPSKQFTRVGRAAGAAADPRPRPAAARTEPRALRALSRAVRAHLAAGEIGPACEAYQRLVQGRPHAALDETTQMRLANVLFRAGRHDLAADAYERFARCYPGHPQVADARYSAGMLYIYKLDQPARGRQLLEKAVTFLTDPAKAKRAKEAIAATLHATRRAHLSDQSER